MDKAHEMWERDRREERAREERERILEYAAAETPQEERTASRHALVRTSPMGGPFLGRCILCGTEGLPSDAVHRECANPRRLSQGHAFLNVLKTDLEQEEPDHA